MTRQTPDEWARHNIVYPPASGRPGPRDPGYTPYMVPIERAFDVVAQVETYGRSFDAIVGVCASQMAKTDTMLDVLGHALDQRPAPILYVGPTKDFLQREIEPRITRLLTGTPRLKGRLATGKRLTRFKKLVGGVPVMLAWAGSGSSFRGTSAKYAIIDELDDIDLSIEGNGDPFTLLESRGATYPDRIRAAISTPKSGTVETEIDACSGLELWKPMQPDDIQSPIWRLWQSGTRHHFTWRCPHCGQWFVPRFKLLRGIENASPAEAKRSAYLECPLNGCVIEECHKAEMNAAGRYVAPGQSISDDGIVTGPLPDTTTLSFWASGLCSPFVSFGERAASYVTAKLSGEQTKIQAAINTGFGELYAPGSGDVPEWEEVAALRRPYRMGQLPAGVKMLTLTADVQRMRILYVVRGWGERGSSWMIEAGELNGPTTENEVWAKLATILTTPIGDFVIRRAFVDSGFRPGKPENVPVNKVYEFCRRFPRLVYPTKGRATADKPLQISKHEVTLRGEARKYGLDLVWLDTDYCKSWVHERVRWPNDEPGFWVIPEDATDYYCKSIVSEARIRRPNGTPTWVPRTRENHFLDCEAMQAGIAHMMSVHLIRAGDDAPPPPVREKRPAGQRLERSRPAVSPPSPPPSSSPPQVVPVALPKSPPVVDQRAQRRARLAELATRIYGLR